MRRARVCYLTNRLAPAGAETFLLHRLQVQDRDRYEPCVVELREGGALKPQFLQAGIQCTTLGAARQFDARAIWGLYQFLRDEKIDILEAHVWYACLVARLVGKLAGVPVIITNEQDVRHGENTVRRDLLLLEDLTTRLSDACVHITQASQRTFVQGTPRILQGQVKRRVIPNGILVEDIQRRADATDRIAKRRELGLPADAFVVGNVARLQPAKGHRWLLEAFRTVLAREPRAHLVLVGWGPSQAELEALAEQLGIAERTHFLGKRLDVYELLPTFDVFAFSSIHEGQGIAILEAMAAGVAIAATDADGIPEMIKDERTGLLVPPRDANAMARAILRLRDEPTLAERVRSGARQLVREQFSVVGIARAYEQLYDELLPVS
jgi:L-malate glycosyltransferase